MCYMYDVYIAKIHLYDHRINRQYGTVHRCSNHSNTYVHVAKLFKALMSMHVEIFVHYYMSEPGGH